MIVRQSGSTQRKRRAGWMAQFRSVQRARWEIDEGICQRVGCWEQGQVHEVEPRGLGGTTHQYTTDEMATLCQGCHGLIHDVGVEVHLKDGRVIGPRGFVDVGGV